MNDVERGLVTPCALRFLRTILGFGLSEVANPKREERVQLLVACCDVSRAEFEQLCR